MGGLKKRIAPDVVSHIFTATKRWKYLTVIIFIVAYAFTTWYYMGPSITNCNTTVYGFGDNTAGPIWRNGVSPASPLWGYQNKTNFPEGENLHSPIHYSGLFQYTAYWSLAKVAGPVCGYNLFNVIGFMSSALIMAGFVYWLLRSKWISFVAGYAVAFTPYFQMKVGGHPSYGYQSILIGLIWASLAFAKNRSIKNSVLLASLLAFCSYFDPYFLLYGVVVVGTTLVAYGALIMLQRSRRHGMSSISVSAIRRSARPVIISLAIYSTLLMPLGILAYGNRDQIQKDVSSVRGNVLFEAKACSNYPHEYFVPFVLHPVPVQLGIEKEYTQAVNYLKGNFPCGIGEDTVGLSLVSVLVVFLFLIIVAWERIKKRNASDGRLSIGNKEVIIISLALLCIGVALALPPVSLYGIDTPTKVLLDVTTTWRTLARSYMLVNIGLVILFACALHFFSESVQSKRLRSILFLIISLVVIVEYQAFTPFSGNSLTTFSYNEDVPPVYMFLKQTEDIRTIAEYPLERYGESDAVSYYVTMQRVHGKQILNSISPTTDQEVIRASIKNIRDPQSVAILRSLGIDAVVLHGVTPSDIDGIYGLETIYASTQQPVNILSNTSTVKRDDVVVARIISTDDMRSEQKPIGLLESGFFRNLGIINDVTDWAYESTEGARIRILAPDQSYLANSGPYCFSIRVSAPSETGTLLLLEVDGERLKASPVLTDKFQRVEIDVRDEIVLKNSKGSNMQITSLGCGQDNN